MKSDGEGKMNTVEKQCVVHVSSRPAIVSSSQSVTLLSLNFLFDFKPASSQASAGIRLNSGPQQGDAWLVQISFRSGFVTHFYLSIPQADFQARLWVNSWTVEYSAILQCKPREVIWAYDAISFEFAF